MDPKKKAAAKKQLEEARPFYARAWVDLSCFCQPGFTTMEERIEVQDTPKEDLDLSATQLNSTQDFKTVIDTRLYIHLKLSMNPGLTPPTPAIPPPTPVDLIPTYPPVPKFRVSADGAEDFRRQVKIGVQAMAQEYFSLFQDQMSDSRFLGDKEKRRDQYITDFNGSGKFHVLKEKLKKSVVRIVKDQFKNIRKTTTSLEFNRSDKFYSELYGLLVTNMMTAFEEMITQRRNQFHADIIVPIENQVTEKEQKISETTGEPVDSRLKRLANEYEFLGNLEKTEQFLKARWEKDKRNLTILKDWQNFMLRHQQYERAETQTREIIHIMGNKTPIDVFITMASELVQSDRAEEASVFLKHANEMDSGKLIPALLAMVVYKDDEILHNKYLAQVKRLGMRHVGLISHRATESGNQPNLVLRDPISAEESREEEKSRLASYSELTVDQVDDLFYAAVDYFTQQELYGVALKFLEMVENRESSLGRFKYKSAQLRFMLHEYDDCVTEVKQLLELMPRSEKAWQLLGSCYFSMSRQNSEEYLELAEDALLKAVRYYSAQKRVPDCEIYKQLGAIYIQKQLWENAKSVYKVYCQFNSDLVRQATARKAAAELMASLKDETTLNDLEVEPATEALEPYKAALSRIFTSYLSLHEALTAFYESTRQEDMKSSINTILYAYSASVSGNMDEVEFSESPPFISLAPGPELEPIAMRWDSLCNAIESAANCEGVVMEHLDEFQNSEINWEEKVQEWSAGIEGQPEKDEFMRAVKENLAKIEGGAKSLEMVKVKASEITKQIVDVIVEVGTVTQLDAISRIGVKAENQGIMDPLQIYEQIAPKTIDVNIPAFVWQGLGRAYLHLGEYDLAEQALTQANILDDINGDTWGNLCYLNLKMTTAPPGNYIKAKQCLNQAILLGLTDESLLLSIGDEFLRKFFLSEGGPHTAKFCVEEAITCYTKAPKDEDFPEHLESIFGEMTCKEEIKLNQEMLITIESSKKRILAEVF